MHTDSVTYVNANNRPSFFFFFIVQTLSFMHCTCNFICSLSDVIIKTVSQSVSLAALRPDFQNFWTQAQKGLGSDRSRDAVGQQS